MSYRFYYDEERKGLGAATDATFLIEIYKNPNVYEDVAVEEDGLVSDSYRSHSYSSHSYSSHSYSSHSYSHTGPDSESSSTSSASSSSTALLSKTAWARMAASIRKSSVKMCQGNISSHFFSGEAVNLTSVLFLLYYLSTRRDGGRQKTLVGFALVDDLRPERGEDEDTDPGTLYIDAICTNTDIRMTRHITVKGAGQLLMSVIEHFARNPDNYLDGEPYTNIKLSALPYVIGYYRRLGYRHVHDCKDLTTVNGLIVESDKDIQAAVKKVEKLKTRFVNDEELDLALLVELAKDKKIVATGKDAKSRRADFLLFNLNDYFKGKNIIFVKKTTTKGVQIVAIDKDTSREDPFTNQLLREDNSAVLAFLHLLTRKKFAVSCHDAFTRYMRHSFKRDSDGEIDFHCLGGGFTMRKCIEAGEDEDTMQMMGGTRRRAKKKTKKNVPWAGWSTLSPSAAQKTTMKKKCGRKCFLGPQKSFPVCVKNTCRVSKKGAWAAFVRARAWGNKRSNYKGRSKPRFTRKVYRDVERKAQKIMGKKA